MRHASLCLLVAPILVHCVSAVRAQGDDGFRLIFDPENGVGWDREKQRVMRRHNKDA